MARVKDRNVSSLTQQKPGVMFWCPGCDEPHGVSVAKPDSDGWQFNGDYDRPTLSPSVLVSANNYVCHSFVQNGQIQFLGDCTHRLANQTIELPELEAAARTEAGDE